MERYGFDFAVTYGQYILTKDRVLFTSPIDKRICQAIDYIKENTARELLSVPGWGIWFSDHEFRMNLQPGLVALCPAKWPIPSVETNKVVLGHPTRSGHPHAPSARTNLPSTDLIESGRDCKKLKKSFGSEIHGLVLCSRCPQPRDFQTRRDPHRWSGIWLWHRWSDGFWRFRMANAFRCWLVHYDGKWNDQCQGNLWHTTTEKWRDGIQRPATLVSLREKELFLSKDDHFNKVKTFHGVMDGETQEKPVVWQPQDALYRTMFKQRVGRICPSSWHKWKNLISSIAARKPWIRLQIRFRQASLRSLLGQVDALINALYLT